MFPPFFSKKYKDFFVHVNSGLLKIEDEQVPIIDGIPRFVKTGSYASLFGDQWKMYKKTQLDSFTGVPISAKRLDRCLGPLKDNLNGALVLEAGCGAGRFTELLLQKGAFLVSSDISSAVEVNKENCPISDKHLIIQADINNTPFQDNCFDVVICLGVIQHTPSPDETIRNLYDLVKPGGYLVIDHYSFNKSYLVRLAPLYRKFLRKMPANKTIPYTQKLVKRYLPLHKKFATSKLLSVLLNRVSPVASYYRAFPELNDKQQEEWALLDTHDGLTDYYKYFRNKKQIIALLKQLGAEDIWCEYGGNGVEARCKKTNNF